MHELNFWTSFGLDGLKRLDAATTKALVVSRSCLTVKGWTAATVPISSDFLALAASARAASMKRREEQRRREEMDRRQALEDELQSKIEEQKKMNKKNSDLAETELCLEKDYTKKIEQKQRNQKLLAELTASTEKTDADLERLRQEARCWKWKGSVCVKAIRQWLLLDRRRCIAKWKTRSLTSVSINFLSKHRRSEHAENFWYECGWHLFF